MYDAKWIDTTEFNESTWEITFYEDKTKTESFTETAYNYPYRHYYLGTSAVANCCLVLPECPYTKEGYTFEGWTNGTGTYVYEPGRVVDFENRKTTSYNANYFTAKWKEN